MNVLLNSKFWEYPTESEKQPVQLLIFPICLILVKNVVLQVAGYSDRTRENCTL
jgi:hypothetical protein